jgi:DNA ligase 1
MKKSHIPEIIAELKKTGSTLEKQRILESHKSDELLRRVFFMTESPYLNYFIKIDPTQVKHHSISRTLDLNILNDIDTKLCGRALTGHAARDWIYDLLAHLHPDDVHIVSGIINHDLDCKVGTAILNKVWPFLIPEMPCMLAAKLDEKSAKTIVDKKDGYIVQRKCDGGRAMALVGGKGDVQFLSRNGKEVEVHGVFSATLSLFPNYVFDGELLVVSDSGVEDRKTGNGFFTKAVRGTITPAEAIRFQYVVWDMIPLADFQTGFSPIPYRKRLKMLMDSVDGKNSRIRLIDGKIVSNINQVNEYYEEMISKGEEGAILKFIDSPWEDKRSKFMIKLKEEKDIDARIIGFTPHKKNKDMFGNFICETEDGKVVFSVGSGLDDEIRLTDPNQYIGKIVECKYNSLITSKGRDEYSLFLPIFKQIRHDKTKANTLEELK